MNLHNRLFAWLGVVSAVVGIVGFLMQVGVAPVLAPLVAELKLPVWLLLCIALALPEITSLAVRRSMARQELSAKEAQVTIANLQQQRNSLQAQVGAMPALSAQADEGKEAVARLATYESLEREVLGVLQGGARVTLLELGLLTSAGQSSQGQQRLARAMASLGSRVSGLNGSYSIAKRADA